MKVFYSDDFSGKWPVPVAAIVVAEDETKARILMEQLLIKHDLEYDDQHFTLIEVSLNKATAIMVSDGEY
jgi:hypothetical protein